MSLEHLVSRQPGHADPIEFSRLPGALEIHRRGVGLLPAPGQPATEPPIWIQPDAKNLPLRLCACKICKKKRKTCHRVRQLNELLQPLAEDLGCGVWEARFDRTFWMRLAKQLAGPAPAACADVRVKQLGPRADEAAGIQILDPKGAELARYFDSAPQRLTLLERLGKAGRHEKAVDRAGVLDRLLMYQRTPQERRFAEAGMPSGRQTWESSLWFRLAYHCLRRFDEPSTGAADFRVTPAIDRESGDFHLEWRRAKVLLLRAAVPRARVQSVLALLAKTFPEQDDLAIHPIPLKTIFRITPDTELDVELRPEVQILQDEGEPTYLRRPDLDRFKYGRLLFVPELNLLAELEDDRKKRTFRTPASVRLRRSQIPTFLDEHRDDVAAGHVVLDEPLQDLQIYTDIDGLELRPVEAESGDAGTVTVDLHLRVGDQRVPVAQAMDAFRRDLPHFEAGNGWIDLQAERLAFLDLLPDADEEGLFQLPPRELLRLRGAVGRPRIEITGDRESIVKALLDQTPPTPYETPEGFRSELRDYQRLGVDWLRSLAAHDLGGLLCDAMGLGKTHQAMALMACLAADSPKRKPPRFLVVCPTSVLGHWRAKLEAFAPELEPHLYHGADRILRGQPKHRARVIITSYGVLRNDRAGLAEIPWRCIVFDEIQYLKNHRTHRYDAATHLEAPCKIGLTGTPIENHLEELKHLFDLVLPGYLGTDTEFRRRFLSAPDPLRQGRAPGTEALRRVVSPFVLRRSKSAVLDELPEKIEDLRTCELSSEQAKLYATVLQQRAKPLIGQVADRSQPVPYLHVFAVLTKLKQICDHPALARRESPSKTSLRPGRSGKWDLFTELLRDCLDSGQKVVVFSQFLGMLDLMSSHLEGLEIDHGRLDGSVRAEERTELIERFNTDPDCRVFLASLKAGGTGIDLVGGSVVIHYDRWWNAAREDQATDRVHRLGQSGVVQVFKLVTEGTLEEKIARLIDHKRSLLTDVVPEDDARLAKIFTRDELLDLIGPLDTTWS